MKRAGTGRGAGATRVRPLRRLRAILAFLAALALYLARRPRRAVRLLAGPDPRELFWLRTAERVVALTLDDGPDPETTGRILDLLGRHGARATFFVLTGNVGDPALLRRLVAEGHELGNHGRLDRPHSRLPPDEFDFELRAAQAALTRFGPVRWFRPGGGVASPAMIERAERLGLRTALADVFPVDTHLGFVPWIVWYVMGAVRPGSIVVLHERGGRGRRTLAALERILPRLAARGYRVTTLSAGAAVAAAAAPSESRRSK